MAAAGVFIDGGMNKVVFHRILMGSIKQNEENLIFPGTFIFQKHTALDE